MNKEKTVLDFAVFVLMEVEELCSCITNFFGQTYNYDPFSEKKILEYEDFVKQEIILKEILLNQELNLDIISLFDLINEQEITNLLNYLNENFTEGFPDGDGFGRSSNLHLKIDDLNVIFEKYLELRKFNQYVFITYFIQLISNIQYANAKKNIELEIKNILNNEKSKKNLKLGLEIEYIKGKKNEYYQKLVENNQFQLKGIITENEINIDFDESLISCLVFLNNDDCYKIRYSAYYNIEFEYSFDFMIHEFLELRLINEIKKTVIISKNNETFKISSKNNKLFKEDNYFVIGLLIAKGDLELRENYNIDGNSFIYKNIAYNSANSVATEISEEIGIKRTSIRPILSATLSNSNRITENRNIFDLNKFDKIENIVKYCKENKIDMTDYFLEKYNSLKIQF